MRDLVKTLTFATLHFSVGFGVTYALTGSVTIATGVALIEPSVNTVVFYFHEKAWRQGPQALSRFFRARFFRARAFQAPLSWRRGAAARLKRSLIANPRPASGTDTTAMPA